MLRVLAAVIAVGALAGTAWLQGSDRQTVMFDPAGPYRIRSATGPVEVIAGDQTTTDAVVQVDRSWFVTEPSATSEAGELSLRCVTRWPCRAAATVLLPATAGSQTVLELSAVEDVVVNHFDGALEATTSATGDVIFGPIRGRVAATTERGSVFGYGLRATEVDVTTTAGEVFLDFLEPPRRVSITAGDAAVTITLPPGDYGVTVDGGSSPDILVGQAADAESQITVHARGPVRIQHTD